METVVAISTREVELVKKQGDLKEELSRWKAQASASRADMKEQQTRAGITLGRIQRELEPYAATCTYELYQILRRHNPETINLRQRLEQAHPGIIDEFKAIFDNYDPYWTERIGGPQTKFVSQRVIDFFLATGTPDDICGQISALQERGIDGVSSVLFSIEKDLEMMERLSRNVMPNFE